MKVLTVKETRSFEKHTMRTLALNSKHLMRKAGSKLVNDFMERVTPTSVEIITIVAGVGNNGGDALVMAIELKQLGLEPNVIIVGDVKLASDAFLHYFDLVGQVKIVNSLEEVNSIQETIFESDYIIDGIFGIGLSKEVSGFRKQLIEYVNESDTNVYSIDIPAGVNPDNGLVMGVAVKADWTGILGNYVVGNLINDSMDYHGKSVVLDIGIIEEMSINREIITLNEFEFEPSKRLHSSNKYTCGLGVFIGGQQSMMGSIQMSGFAGLKSGLGIVKVLSNLENNSFTQFYPELIIAHNTGKEDITEFEKAKACVYGPGIDDYPNHRTILKSLLDSDVPLVIDAKGLEHIELKKQKNESIILTPHIGELSKLLNIEAGEIKKNLLKHLKTLTDLGYNVLLKGSCNILATKSRVVFIQVRNTGLATAGSGDILSGIIAANIIKEDIIEGMINSVYIHTAAADFAKAEFGEVSLTASNILNNIHKVYRG
jgi:NAD(P)H-hydrate epimerase